jgi:formylglycine-generating enzyme required for sulfatase activity
MRLAPAVLLAAGWLAGCGRIGIDLRDDASTDGITVGDAAGGCPPGTTELEAGADACIELVERGAGSWDDADTECRLQGRRLCTDAQWVLACQRAQGLVDMVNDKGGATPNWEWTADRDGEDAVKRGLVTCDDVSSSEGKKGNYDFRCCAAKS